MSSIFEILSFMSCILLVTFASEFSVQVPKFFISIFPSVLLSLFILFPLASLELITSFVQLCFHKSLNGFVHFLFKGPL